MSLSHRANPVSHRRKQPKTVFRTVQQTVLGLSSKRPQQKKTFALSLSIFGHIGCFDTFAAKHDHKVCKPWFPNRGSRLPAEQGLKRGKREVKKR